MTLGIQMLRRFSCGIVALFLLVFVFPRAHAEQKSVWRWRAKITHAVANSNFKTKLAASVYDPTGSPVLMEFHLSINPDFSLSNSSSIDLSMDDVEKFSVIVPAKGGKDEKAFRIDLKDRANLVSQSKTSSGLRADSLLLNADGRVVFLRQVDAAQKGKKPIWRASMAKLNREEILAEEMSWTKGFPKQSLVMEPETIHPVSYNTYFLPKLVSMPELGVGSASVTRTYISGSDDYSGWSSYSPQVSVRESSDLRLGEALKGKEVQVWELLQMVEKPRVSHLLKVIGRIPRASEPNPFQSYRRSGEFLRSSLRDKLPSVIAQLEHAYPNAIYYALGRDIYLLGDALDAFYISVGQADRIRRLGASQPSFNERDVNEVIDFLQSNGFDFEKIDSNSRSQIIFDITSYSKGYRFSQSSQLMRAAYTKWKELNRDPKLLLSKVNFVSTSSGYRNERITPDLNLERYFNQMTFDPAPESILRVEDVGALQYSTAWHGLYRPFKKNPQGETYAPPGEPSDYSTKLEMLGELWDVAAVTMNADFLTRVNAEFVRFQPKCQALFKKPNANSLLGRGT